MVELKHSTQRTVLRYGLFAFILLILVLFLLWPIYLTVQGAFIPPGEAGESGGGFTLDPFFHPTEGVLRDPIYLKGLLNALLIAIGTTVGCLVLTLPMAVLATKYKFPGQGFVSALVLVPLILPPFVGAIGLQAILGRAGTLNAFLRDIGLLGADAPGIDFLGGRFDILGFELDGRFWAVVIMQVLHLYPILYLNITAALANLDPALDEAAQNLGASKIKRFFQVTLPLILPGVFAGGTIVFIWAFTELGTPLMFEFKTVTPVQVFYGLTEVESSPQPYALVVVMLVSAVLLYLLGKWAFGGRAHAMQSKASHAAPPKKLTGLKGLGATAFFFGVTAIAVAPHLGVIFSSFAVDGTWYDTLLPASLTTDHYQGMLNHDLAMSSIFNSLKYALIAMVFCIAIGLAIAYLNVRVKIKGGGLLDTLGMLPLAVPGLVMAFGYVAMSLHWPFPQLAAFFTGLGWDGVASVFQVRGQMPNPLVFLVIAYTIRRLPYILRSASAGLEQTSGQLEEAALNLGASTATAIRRVVVPLIMANLIAGGILVFSFAMLEVSDSLILAEKEPHYPITKAIWTLYNRLGDGQSIASAMGVWGMALLTLTLVAASVLMGKKLGAIFRV
ncbi:MAG: iron ABC transporter permease [Planctomycetota bacterium]